MSIRTVILAVFLACLVTGISAVAQDSSPIIARALKTLSEIDRILANLQSGRQSGGNFSTPAGAGWVNLFDGKSLDGWNRTDFAAGGEVHVEKSFKGVPAAIVVDMGDTLSGFNYTGEVPRTRYEIELEAMKLDGNDFICGLTFPVGDSHASLILGGWGGGVVGISSIDNSDASENETTKYISFDRNRWYKIVMRVTPAKLEAWLDGNKIVDQDIKGRKISLRPGDISRSIPLGISTFRTSTAFRAIRIRRLTVD